MQPSLIPVISLSADLPASQFTPHITEMGTTFLALLLAHLLGDFVLQPGSWVRQKSLRGYKSKYFWYHLFTHGLLALLVIGQLQFWPYALLLFILHGAIDQLKSEKERTFKLPGVSRQPSKSIRRWFWYDQLLHLFTLLLTAFLWIATTKAQGSFPDLLKAIGTQLQQLWTPQLMYLLTLVVFLTTPSAIIIRTLINGWTPHYPTTLETDSLKNAGTYIGILERLFVFTFMISGHIEAVGFLLAAKSIFRFGDLSAARDRKLTEYVLIGTLISFGLAIATAFMYLGFNRP